MIRRILLTGLLVSLVAAVMAVPAQAATPAEIEQSIEDGLVWLVGQQNADGSWGASDQVPHTGLAVVKLADRAHELGFQPPDYAGFQYAQNLLDGLDYIFSQAELCADPEVCFYEGLHHESYSTGIALIAIVSSRDPNHVVNIGNPNVDNMTYAQVAQSIVNYLASSQKASGGWDYNKNPDPRADNSITGYVVLGLDYAESPEFGFNAVVPPVVKTKLNNWIDYIQNDVDGDTNDGGSGYTAPEEWVNILKTGNLIYEMAFYGDGPGTERVIDAVDYIERHWNDANPDPGFRNPPHYQSMYCMMKGLERMGIDTINVNLDPNYDWFNEVSSIIVNSQNANGSWPTDNWGDQVLTTSWALLTLEKVAPPAPPPPGVGGTTSYFADSGSASGWAHVYTVTLVAITGVLAIGAIGWYARRRWQRGR